MRCAHTWQYSYAVRPHLTVLLVCSAPTPDSTTVCSAPTPDSTTRMQCAHTWQYYCMRCAHTWQYYCMRSAHTWQYLYAVRPQLTVLVCGAPTPEARIQVGRAGSPHGLLVELAGRGKGRPVAAAHHLQQSKDDKFKKMQKFSILSESFRAILINKKARIIQWIYMGKCKI
jgi:hypothetical protein